MSWSEWRDQNFALMMRAIFNLANFLIIGKNMSLFQLTMIFGFSLASLHVCWVLLIAVGWAQPVIDFIFKLHMLSSPFQVQPFELPLALGLIGITFLIGCFYGIVFFVVKRAFEKQ